MSSSTEPTTEPSAKLTPAKKTEMKKVVGASSVGTIIEWYEFFLYGSIAATGIFGTLFFPNSDNPLDGIIAAFATYAIGFIARPLGGLVFGHYGDRFGRKRLLQISLIMVGVATFLMGCLPGFGTIGYAAPVLLVLLRFIQGFAVGGEWGGAVLLVAEHSPKNQRGFWGSWPQAGVPGGNLLATIVLLILSTAMPQDQYESWGWRIAFWLSAVIVLVGYYIRKKVEDAPIFLETLQKAETEKQHSLGVVEVVKRYPKGVLVSMGARLTENIMYYATVTFSLTYLTVYLGVNLSNSLLVLLAAHTVHFISVPLWGALSDRVGRRPVFMTGSVLTIGWAFLFFPLLDTMNDGLILVGMVLGLALQGMMYAPQPAIMSELFPTRMRYSGVSLGYQVTSILAGSLAPLICTLLLDRFNSTIPISIYISTAAVLSTIALWASRESRGTDLRDVDQADADRLAQTEGK